MYNVECETSRSVDVCESNQVTLGAMRGVFTSFFLRLYATDLGSKIYFI